MTTGPTPRNAATALAETVVDELVRGGVRHLVLAPGSRSAALAFAAYTAAEEGRLTLHTRIDERTAGFLALGLAKSSRTPVAVVTTSGTAAANLHPAVLEASHAGVELLAITADRPAHLRGTGANQTTDQAKLFGTAVRAFSDLPAPHPGASEAAQVQGWRAAVARMLLTVRGHGGGPQGPAHLNLQFDGPLTPEASDGWMAPMGGRAAGAPWVMAPERPSVEPVTLDASVRTAVVAGDDAGPPARLLAEAGGWPLLAEPTSGSRTGANAIRSYRLLLTDPELTSRIERVVVAGHPTLGRPVQRLLARTDLEIIALASPSSPYPSWADPGQGVSRVVPAAVVEQSPTDTSWLQAWLDRDAVVAGRVDALVDALPGLTAYHVARTVAAALPPQGLLYAGSSNPIRDLDLMIPRYPAGQARLVLGNRGLAGIDGTLSSAIGAVLGRRRQGRSFLLCGDLTFLHDLTALVLGPTELRPDLTIVVANDDGGSIFATLEQGAPEYAASFEKLFGTPHGVDLGAVCAGLGVPHTRAKDEVSLTEALARAPRGIEVVEAVVRRDDRRDLDAAIRALAAT